MGNKEQPQARICHFCYFGDSGSCSEKHILEKYEQKAHEARIYLKEYINVVMKYASSCAFAADRDPWGMSAIRNGVRRGFVLRGPHAGWQTKTRPNYEAIEIDREIRRKLYENKKGR